MLFYISINIVLKKYCLLLPLCAEYFMKKFFLLFSFLVTIITLSWAAFFPQQYHPVSYEYIDSKNNIQLTFFGFKWETDNVRTIEQLITEFMNQNKTVNVLYEGIKGRAYFPVLERRMQTENGDDLFMINQDTLLALSQRGNLVDLSELNEINEYSALTLSQIREKDGSVFALPTSVSAFGLYCNLDLLKKYQISVPNNITEFLDACKVFSEAGITPIIANNDISLKTLVMARGMPALYQSGEATFSEINTGKFPLSTYLRSGFELLEYLCEHGYIDRERALATEKTKDDLIDFAQGESPFMLTGVWASVRLKKLVSFQYTIVPYPVLEDGTALVVNIDTRLALNAHGKHLPEAKSFLRYLIRPESINRFCAGQASFSPLKSVSLEAPLLQAIGENLRSGRAIVGADSRFAFPIWEISRLASLSILKGATTEQALGYLDDAVSDAISGGNL